MTETTISENVAQQTGAEDATRISAADAPEEQQFDTLISPSEDARRHFEVAREKVEQEQRRSWKNQVDQWRKEVEGDPELGGAALEGNLERARAALDRFDPDRGIASWLSLSGYGNHPLVLRFLMRIADAAEDDGVVTGSTPGERMPLEDRMYGDWRP